MAGNWIPWEIGLEKKREVVVIARLLGVSRLEAATMCMIVWAWAEDQSVDGVVSGVDAAAISDCVGIPGIGEAMANPACGWIVESESAIQFPNWERFNSRPAKMRMHAVWRQRKSRMSQKVVTNVTGERDKCHRKL